MTPSRDAYIEAPSPIEPELRQLFPDGARVVFDIGSCEGEDAIRYATLFPGATVFAVEPLRSNVLRIRDNLERHPRSNVRVMQLALSDRIGLAPFHVSSGSPTGVPASDWDYGNKSSSLLPPARHLEVHPWVRFDEVVEVETDTLERVCAREGVTSIDLVHLDVQGAELKVLLGAGQLLPRIGAVWLEVEAIPLYEGQPLKPDIERFMRRYGFTRLLDTVGRVAGDQLWVHLDIVSVPSSRARLLRAARHMVGRDAAGLRRRTAANPGRSLALDRSARAALQVVRVASAWILGPARKRAEIRQWRAAGRPVPPPSAVKQATVRAYSRTLGLRTLVETGTYLGDMVEAQRRHFESIWSIELSPELHDAAAARFSRARNVVLLQGDSGELMPTVLDRLVGPALFWLDGHYSAGITARGILETPVARELETILASGYDHCILVDDARCFGSGDYPTLDEVRVLVAERRPGWSCVVRDDIIRIHPPLASDR